MLAHGLAGDSGEAATGGALKHAPSISGVSSEFDSIVSDQSVARQFDIREVLGSGSYASVKRAIDRKTGREYACKIIEKRKYQMLPEARLGQLMREVKLLHSISHQNIVRLETCR